MNNLNNELQNSSEKELKLPLLRKTNYLLVIAFVGALVVFVTVLTQVKNDNDITTLGQILLPVGGLTFLISFFWSVGTREKEQERKEVACFKAVTGKTIPECQFRVVKTITLENRMGSNQTLRMYLEEVDTKLQVIFDFKLGQKKYYRGMQLEPGDPLEISTEDMGAFVCVAK